MNEELRKEIKGTILESIDRKKLEGNLPDAFFADLSDQIIKQSKQKNKIKTWNFNPILYATAASLALIVGILYMYNLKNINQDQNIFQNMESQDLIDYASIEFDSEELYDLQIENLDYGTSFSDIDNDILEKYLEDKSEVIELSELIEYL